MPISLARRYIVIYIYICVCVCVCVYIYIYIYKERERDEERFQNLNIHWEITYLNTWCNNHLRWKWNRQPEFNFQTSRWFPLICPLMTVDKYVGKLGCFVLVRQPVQGSENSRFRPAAPRLKIDFASHRTRNVGVRWMYTYSNFVLQASNNIEIVNICTRLWLTELEQATPID